MKKVTQSLAILVAVVALSASAFAGECCDKSVKSAKAGKTCEKCAKEACCKEAVAKASKAGETKTCTVCAAKEKSK